MNAAITRDVIVDLLPAYLSGEASAATRALIEAYIKEDPELAQLIRKGSEVMLATGQSPALGQDHELKALHDTKRLLRRRGWHLGLAIFFSLIAITYHFGPDGLHWTFKDFPLIAVLSVSAGACFWFAYFNSKHRTKSVGI